MSATLLTSKQVRELLSISPATLHRMTVDGRLPKPIKMFPGKTGRVRFDAEKVAAAIAALQS